VELSGTKKLTEQEKCRYYISFSIWTSPYYRT